MEKVMNSFINEHRDAFNEHFNKHVNDKLSNREDYKEIMDKIHALFEKYPKLRAFIASWKEFVKVSSPLSSCNKSLKSFPNWTLYVPDFILSRFFSNSL